MAVKIKLMRLGKIRNPQYRIVVADSRTKRDGRAIEEIGKYHPKEDPSFIEVKSERVQYWLGVGAQPTESVTAILKVTGDWQKFKGLPGAEGTLRVAPERVDRAAVFAAAAAEAANVAPTPKPKPKAAEPKAAEPVAETPAESVAEPVAEAPAETVAEAPAEAVAEAPAAEEAPAADAPAAAAVESTEA